LLRGGVQTPLTVKQLEARLASSNTAGDAADMANSADLDMFTPQGPSKIDMIRKRVIEQAKQDPETVARLVRVWLNEEKNR
jgi:flagellar biosynthesis/type III secretory pathway M-ring protein FliF/YscJ